MAGHAGAGKTTLAEQILFKAGAIPRLGRVDDGTAHLDYEPEEQKRQESLSLAVATFEHDSTRITIVDTHIASLIAAALLFQFGTSPIRGFATMMTIGLLANVFTAVFVSRTMFELSLRRQRRGDTLSI